MLLAAGVLSIVLLMLIVMGAPYLYYLKRDKQWEAQGRNPEQWYQD